MGTLHLSLALSPRQEAGRSLERKTAPEGSGAQGLGGREERSIYRFREGWNIAVTWPPEHWLASVLAGGHLPSCCEEGTTKLHCIKRKLNAGREARGLGPGSCKEALGCVIHHQRAWDGPGRHTLALWPSCPWKAARCFLEKSQWVLGIVSNANLKVLRASPWSFLCSPV